MATASPKYLKPILIGATITAICSGVGFYAWREQHRDPLLEIYIFSLKSGRSMFIRTPDDHRALIDGGGNSQVIRHLSGILPFYSRRIDTVISTGQDGKNSSGLVDVLKRYDVGQVFVSGYTLEELGIASSTDKIHETFLETVHQQGIRMEKVMKGDKIKLGNEVLMRVLFPVSPDEFEYSKASFPELLFSIIYKKASVLFMGDASKKVQKHVSSSSREIISGSDTLIVSHSAAATNMSDELLRVSRPNHLIYEKTITKKPGSKKKNVSDPLAGILDENRFNLKEVGLVKVVSDGEHAEIKMAP